MTRVATALKKARVKNGMTQEQASKKMKLSRPQYVSHIELGKCQPSPRIMKAMCSIYNLDINKVLSLHMKDYKENFINKLAL